MLLFTNPHFSCTLQLVQVLQPPISSILPSWQIGHISSASDDSNESKIWVTSAPLLQVLQIHCHLLKVNTCESRLPSTYTVPPLAPP